MNSYRDTVQRWATSSAPPSRLGADQFDDSDHAPPQKIMAVANELMTDRGGRGPCRRIHVSALVADHDDKWIICDASGRPRLVVMMSHPDFPETVGAAAARAIAVRDRLDQSAAAAVVVPLARGDCQGLSFAITPYLKPIATRGPWAMWDRWRLRAAILCWLRDVNRRTAQPAGADAVTVDFVEPLLHLAANDAMTPTVRTQAHDALVELDAGRWHPMHVAAHNDLWTGNVLLRQDDGSDSGFGIIDWGASRCDGHAAYDLVRLAMSLKLSRARFVDELAVHARILGCRFGQMRHHLVSALAWLGDHLGEWPQTRFAETAECCTGYLDLAIRSAERD